MPVEWTKGIRADGDDPVAIDVGPADLTLDTDHPLADLPIKAGLDAAEEAVRAVAAQTVVPATNGKNGSTRVLSNSAEPQPRWPPI